MKFDLLTWGGLASLVLLAGCGSTPNSADLSSPSAPRSSSSTATLGHTTSGAPPATPTKPAPIIKIQGGKNPTKWPTPRKGTDLESKRLFPLNTLKTVALTCGSHSFTAWIMDTPAKREEGLMFLQNNDIKDNQGMIFVFPQAQMQSFWMHGTYTPLDIVYIDPSGKVLNSVHGKILDDTPLLSKGSAKYVIEMKAGDGAKMGLVAGAKVNIPKTLVTLE